MSKYSSQPIVEDAYFSYKENRRKRKASNDSLIKLNKSKQINSNEETSSNVNPVTPDGDHLQQFIKESAKRAGNLLNEIDNQILYLENCLIEVRRRKNTVERLKEQFETI
jgi:hypothetical protein